MPKRGQKAPRKRIYNPLTGKYYALRLHSSTEGRKGTIKGLWKRPKQPFNFYKAIDHPLGIYAHCLSDFGEKIQSVDIASLEFHLKRGDFESWIRYLGNTDLEKRMRDVREEEYRGEMLRKVLSKIIER